MKKPIIVAFANQKGGAGKSTIGTHVASALHYIYGYKVAMADFDQPQWSVVAYRKDEDNAVRLDPKLGEKFLKQGAKAYPVIKSSVKDATQTLDLLEKDDYDFILVDTPGYLNLVGLSELLERLDYVFLPMESDKGTITSTMAFIKLLQTQFLPTVNEQANLKGVYAFWNKHMKAERQTIYEGVTGRFAELGYPMLHTRIENLITYKENRSTMFSLPERELDRLGLGKMIKEILTIMLGPGQTTPSGKEIEFTQATTDEVIELPTPAPTSSPLLEDSVGPNLLVANNE